MEIGVRGKSYMYRESLAVKIQEVLGQESIYTSVFWQKRRKCDCPRFGGAIFEKGKS